MPNRIPAHPGQILLEEFLNPLAITQIALAQHTGMSLQRVNQIVRGKRGISAETAWLLSESFNTTPQFWMNLQTQHDLAIARRKRHIKSMIA